MKKAVFIVTLFALTSASAQRSVRDTLMRWDSTYYCISRDHRVFEEQCTVAIYWGFCRGLTNYDMSAPYGSYSIRDLYGNTDGPNMWQGNGIEGRQMETDKPLKILGIAAPVRIVPGYYLGIGPYEYCTVDDTSMATRPADSMVLYKVTADGLSELKSASWRSDNPHCTMFFPLGYLWDRSGPVTATWDAPDYSLRTLQVPLYEAMFDEPVIVEDSFVVAGVAMNNEGHFYKYDRLVNEEYWAFEHNPTRYLRYYYEIGALEDTVYGSHYLMNWVKYRNRPWKRLECELELFYGPDSSRWIFESPLVFPIIELGFDTALCHDVSGLRVAEFGAGQATLMWDSGDGGPWEVAIGKATDPWESYTITTTTVPMATVTGLQRGVQYFALVRGYCSLTEEYGQWSEPVEVEVFQDPEPEGIGREAVEDGMTYMVPNPTSGVTNVMSSYRMQRIAVYDTKGTKVHEQEVDGIAAEVDASAWPKGVYIVAMYLDHGVKTRRLVVQ